MGMFQVRVKVSNPEDPDKSFEESFWVDTGAIYSFIPAGRLAAIGVKPSGERTVVYADGRSERLPFGHPHLEVEGMKERNPCAVIFSAPGVAPLLGATALENFGVTADPVEGKLKPILAIIGGFRASK